MSDEIDGPVTVTGEERKHPAIRKLARACIELARLRLAKKEAPCEVSAEKAPKYQGRHRRGGQR
jgi:hypothetical protein